MDIKKLEKRLYIFLGIVVFVFVVLAAGLSYLQVVKGDEYEKLAQENRIRLIPVTAPRGVFKDRHGKELVNSRPSFTVSYMNVKSDKKDRSKVFDTLSDILNIPRYTEATAEQYTVNKKKEIPLKSPLFDRNGDGKVDSLDVNIVEYSSGKQVKVLKIEPETGVVKLDCKPGTKVLTSYVYDVFENKLRSQSHKKYMPVRLKTDIDFKTIAKIEERRLPGIVIEVEPTRNYLYGNLGSHLFGYVGEINEKELKASKDKGYRPGDLVGKMGLEKALEPYLKGKDGGQQVEVTAGGKPIKVLGQREPVPGKTVNLTIDMNLQQIAEKALREKMLELQEGKYPNAKKGAVVVSNVKTGEILAMVSVPDFDPNIFARGITNKEWKAISSDPLRPMINVATSGTYPPGSVFKMVVSTAALEEKVTTKQEYINDNGVYWTIAPKKCWKRGGHGKVDAIRAIAESCNTYFYEMGRRIGIDNIEKYAKMYGLGKSTGIELEEKSGHVANREYKKKAFKNPQDKIWYPAETLDAAIGQGYHSFTPLQVANYIAAIANEGSLMKPYLVKSIVDSDGNIVLEKKPEVVGKIPASKETFEIIKKGMLGVTSPRGTAYSTFSDFPISVAAKTGTAQWNLSKDPHGWFVAFAPYESPEISIAVFIEQAGSGGAGSSIAKTIIESYLHLNKEDTSQDYLIQP